MVPEPERRLIADRYRHQHGPEVRQKVLAKADIERGFVLLNEVLAKDGVHATVNLVGGAVMLLVYDVRPATQDIDGWIVPENHIERHIRSVGRQLGDERWLHEQALMYFPDHHPGKGDFIPCRDYSHVSVQVADERTMFAMKALALRNPKDRNDFLFLAKILNIRTVEEAMTVIGTYYRDVSPDKIVNIAGVLDELNPRRR